MKTTEQAEIRSPGGTLIAQMCGGETRREGHAKIMYFLSQLKTVLGWWAGGPSFKLKSQGVIRFSVYCAGWRKNVSQIP